MEHIIGKFIIEGIQRPLFPEFTIDMKTGMESLTVPLLNRNLSLVDVFGKGGYSWPFFLPVSAILYGTHHIIRRIAKGVSFDAEGLLIAHEGNYDLDNCRWLISSLKVYGDK